MHAIKSIVIRGFRGQTKPIKISLDPHANFIIGRNGTGKTTLINLINACLTADVSILLAQSFDSVLFVLKEDGKTQTPTIEVIKDESSPDSPLQYAVRPSSKGDPTVFFPIQNEIREVRLASGRIIRRREPISRNDPNGPLALRKVLMSLFRKTWLSLQRAEDDLEFSDEFDDIRNLVDYKLSNVFNELTRYFSRLDSLVADETKEFQKEWFLFFLSAKAEVSPKDFGEIDFAQEKSALASIFEKFNLDKLHYADLLEERFSKLERIKSGQVDEKTSGLSELSMILDTIRLHSLVDKWKDLQDAQIQTYEPKTQFIEICSDLLYAKRLEVDRSNKISIISDDNNNIPIQFLSSGEKQLLIFLSETLLQEKERHLFLADEPELSLHIEWQIDLVPSLLKINPNAQVLFATHSPDIVGGYQDNITQMEEIIR